MLRRDLLKTLAPAGLAAFLIPEKGVSATDAEIVVQPLETGPAISPQIYGHFIEHLGGVIYDGVWVGRDSKIANVDGIRKQFVDDMKRIGAPNLRWPGGCFADGYHWRDGIGSKRSRTYNNWQLRMPAGVDGTETNQFGTHEFMRLCHLIGAEPYLAGNVGSSTPREFHDWVTYCNAPPGTASLADERAANGDKEPFRVQYWGVGNESWGCGGGMKPHEYAAEYRKFITQFPMYTRPFLVATGPRGHQADFDIPWTVGLFEGLGGRFPDGLGLHYYTDLRPTGLKGGSFSAKEWYEVLRKGALIERIIEEHWSAMGQADPAHKTKFVIDEWGAWYPPGEEIGPRYTLSQPMTLRDALHTGMTFDIFNRHADKIAMANVAQTINCIHSLFLAQEDKFTRTPAYYVFEMYRSHMGARLAPMMISAPQFSAPALNGTVRMAGLAGSASVRDGGRMTVTLTNASLDDAVSARIRLTGGARAAEARGVVLTHSNMQAGNTFQAPDTVTPAPLAVSVNGGSLSLTVPRQAVVALDVRIA
jgi:alpha-L-arabinofuranosidase